MNNNIFEKRVNILPYEYPSLLAYKDAIRHSYWIHTEFNFTTDIDDFKTKGKTVIIIAHRLSTIANANQILVIENGTIVESGNHPELLNQKGKYFKLWNKQSLV